MNTVPLLELSRSALKPHPFLPKMAVITSFKRRSNATHVATLRASEAAADHGVVSMDGAALFEKALQLTSPLAESASPEMRDRVWLCRRPQDGLVTAMSAGTLADQISRLVKRHGLRSDDGGVLRLNNQRLRKTLENRLWSLSNGDLFAVSSLMGHTPRVADQHYLAVTPEMRANATIVGEALPDIYSGRTVVEADAHAPGLARTPVGNCNDTLFGDKAPKDGASHCVDFLSCFGCRSFAIVGSPEDLHRLFSFYWFLHGERSRMDSPSWKDHYAWLMGLIDAFTADKFDAARVADAKQSAKSEPLPFWARYASRMATAHG